MRSANTGFEPDQLLDSLARLPAPSRYWVGFSGGADSTALLQALHECRGQLAASIHAIHFHHGLQPAADDWQGHCRKFCAEREIPFTSVRLDIPRSRGASLEEESRNSRYRSVAEILGDSEMYLTAHHAEDQAETLFLNLMRGSGVEGLAGIPALRNLENGWVARPLLDWHRADLEHFLNQRKIDWLTDPSNEDVRFDRNYLRHEVFPLLEQRWPGLVRRLSRAARNARITANAMAMFIENQSGDLVRDEIKMPLLKLLELDPEMQTLILRQWLRRQEVPVLPEARLRELLNQLDLADVANQAEVRWDDWIIKRYKHDLWLHPNPPFEPLTETDWNRGMELDLGPDSGSLCLRGRQVDIPAAWKVRARSSGDRIRLLAHGPSRKIKQYFQSALIPPWLRCGIPVLVWDGEPAALGDWVIDHRLQAWLAEHELELEWRPRDPVLMRLRHDNQRGL